MSDAAPPPVTSRSWTLCTRDGEVDVEITARDDACLADVLPEIGTLVGGREVTLWAGSRPLAGELPLAATELAHGAVLGLGAPGPRTDARERSSALELHVVGGPDAGRTVPLVQGRHVLGRGGEATLRLADPDVSRRHALVEVGAGEILVTDLGSTNGTRLDGEELRARPRAWEAGALLRLGATSLMVTGPRACPAALEPRPGGRLGVRPAPRLAAPRPEIEVPFPSPPADRPARRLAWAAVVLPILGGVALATLMRTPGFLLFTVLSPLVAIGTWCSDRWSGRRTRRQETAAHAAALAAAQERLAEALLSDRRAAALVHPDLAALAGAARRRSALVWSRRPDEPDALCIRLGTGPGTTNVTTVEEQGARIRRSSPELPAVLDLRTSGGLAVVGPRPAALGVLVAAVAQLAALHPPGAVDLVLVSERRRLADWTWARWLPHLDPAAVLTEPEDIAVRLPALLARPRSSAGAPSGWLVVVVDRPLDPALAARLRAAREAQVLTLAMGESMETLPATGAAVLRTGGEVGATATLCRPGVPDLGPVVVDRLPRGTAADLARDLAPLAPPASAAALPRKVRLLESAGDGIALDGNDAIVGRWHRSRSALVATLGRTVDGPARIDLCRVGPHALVAGTTGAGKSELLQTLISSLALHHPPDRCSFLLVDYKGGAAFAEAATLPHTVGILTDLDGSTTARALRSLAAELARREALLAAHGAADVGQLPEAIGLARLVIVVDEFATLVEELPQFVPGLVGIAQRGRSLGVHLVLATQRPSGVVSPEIRANCNLRICLRTTDETDSRDVLGTSDAAHLPVDVPGRAYLRSGSAPPTLLQVARVSVPADEGAGPRVRRWSWPALPEQASERARGASTDLARIAGSLRRLSSDRGLAPPHRPWHPPLPDRVQVADLRSGERRRDDPLSGSTGTSGRLLIGLVDRPDTQSQHPLELDLDQGGGWLAVGGPRSGRTTLLRTVLGTAAAGLAPEELHVHVLDHGGGALAAEAAGLPHTGTAVGGHDPLRTVRLLDRLAQEVADRRSGRRPGPHPLLLLLVDGAEALIAQLEECDPSAGVGALLRLVREGGAAGLTCVLTADRAVPGGRLASVADQRLLLPLPDRADYAVAGIRASEVPTHRPPGRALWGEDAVECQLALPPENPPDSAGRRRSAGGPGRALRIPELPADPARSLGAPVLREPVAGTRLRVGIGPGGDEGELLTVDLAETGGLLVVGPPGSGRTATLDALAEELRRRGTPVLHLGGSAAPRRAAGPPDGAWLAADDTAGLAAWLQSLGDRVGAVIADEVGPPPEWPTLTALPGRSSAGAVVLLAAGSAAGFTSHYQGTIGALRRHRSGLLLTPGPAEADLLGIRLPRTPLPVRPGSGWLVRSGVAQRVQVARRRPSVEGTVGHPEARESSGTAGGHSSSSIGPIS